MCRYPSFALVIDDAMDYNIHMIERDDEKVKRILASNIASYRKESNLTQSELAEKIFYSDKSVSKWERAEGVPDICVLVMLADLFGVTVNDLLSEKHKKSKHVAPKLKHVIVTLMSIGLVWLVATVVFFVIKIAAPTLAKAWLTFIYAIPVTFIVSFVFSSLWHTIVSRFLSLSGIIWGIALALDVTFSIQNMFLIYPIAGALQVLVILWFLLKTTPILINFCNKLKNRPSKKSKLGKKQKTPAKALDATPEQ